MLKRSLRLKGKDINFLIKRRKYFPTKYFGYFYYDQYPNLNFHQISVNIPLKYSKKAVDRSAVKRQIISFIQDKELNSKRINGKYYKIFVTLNKKNITELKSQTEKFDKKAINHYI
jgi:ribonuclease P protein component